MDEQELKDANDLQEVAKMMKSMGWAVALVSLNADRERIIGLVSGADQGGDSQRHGWEYYQGLLAGFQRAVSIFDNLNAKYEEYLEISRREREEKDGEEKS